MIIRPGCAFCAVALVLQSAGVMAVPSVSVGGRVWGDNEGFQLQHYQGELRRDETTNGQWLTLRWYRYFLNEELAGIRPFEGSELAVELGARLLWDLWWIALSGGLQGSIDLQGARGALILARAIPLGSSTLTPRLELAREALGLAPLPLSLGMSSNRAEALLAWRASAWFAEGGFRMEFWESATASGRVSNPALEVIPSNRIAMVHGYLLSQRGGWFDWGVAAKAAWAKNNTMVATQIQPTYSYTWYPASAPPFALETAAVLRVQHQPLSALELALQFQLPLVSLEARQWESVKKTSWGTAPLELKFEGRWFIFPSTALRVASTLFIKPWDNWKLFAAEGYRQLGIDVSLEQRFW